MGNSVNPLSWPLSDSFGAMLQYRSLDLILFVMKETGDGNDDSPSR